MNSNEMKLMLLHGSVAARLGLLSSEDGQPSLDEWLKSGQGALREDASSEAVPFHAAHSVIAEEVERRLGESAGDIDAALASLLGETMEVDQDELRTTLSWMVDRIPQAMAPESQSLVFGEMPGRYSDIVEFGRGGLGKVLIVHDHTLGRRIALKEMLDGRAGAASGASETPVSHRAARFVREARITSQLEHPSIVPVYEAGQRPDGTLYYTMKFIRGETFEGAVKKRATPRERLHLLSHFLDVCQAVAYAHSRGIIHRDIKPSNIMIGEFGETVVLDWGLAKILRSPDTGHLGEEGLGNDEGAAGQDRFLTRSGAIAGTPAFMSPEQARGEIELDQRSDVYALGALLHVVLTGKSPFCGLSPQKIVRQLQQGELASAFRSIHGAPPELASICRKAMSYNPADRYAHAGEMAAEIGRYQAGDAVEAHRYGILGHSRRWIGHHRGMSLVAAVAMCVLTLTVTGFSLRLLGTNRDLDAARERAVAANASSQKEYYYTTILLADTRMQQGQREENRRLLDAAPAELRNWEWGYLRLGSEPPGEELWRGDRAIVAVACTPDTGIVATSSGGGIQVLSGADYDTLWEWTSAGRMKAMAIDGRTSNVFAVWDRSPSELGLDVFAPDGHLVHEASLSGIQGNIARLHVPRDAHVAYVTGVDGQVRIVDTTTYEVTRERVPGPVLSSVGGSRDGTLVAFGYYDGRVRLFPGDLSEELAAFQVLQTPVYEVQFIDGSSRMMVLGYGECALWDYETQQAVARPHIGDYLSEFMAMSPGSTEFAIGGDSGNIHLVSAADGTVRHVLRTGIHILSLVYRGDEEKLLVGDTTGCLRLLDIAEARTEPHEFPLASPSMETGMACAFSADGSILAGTGWPSGRIALWQFPGGTLMREVETGGETWFLHFAGTGELVYSSDASVRCLRMDDFTSRVLFQGEATVLRAAVDDRLRYLVVAQDHVPTLLLNLETQETVLLDSLPEMPNGGGAATLSKDGSRVAMASTAGQGSLLLSLPDLTPIRSIDGFRQGVNCMVFSADGRYLAQAGTQEHLVKVWDLEGDAGPWILTGHSARIEWLVFDADGTRLFSASRDHTVRVWDFASEREMLRLPNTNYFALSATLSPDGTTLVSSDSAPAFRVRRAAPWRSTPLL